MSMTAKERAQMTRLKAVNSTLRTALEREINRNRELLIEAVDLRAKVEAIETVLRDNEG